MATAVQNVKLTLEKCNEILAEGSTIIDIGCGKHQEHTKWFKDKGFSVDTCDIYENSTYTGLFTEVEIDKKYDLVWASHVLEHQENVGLFLRKCYSICKDSGKICITVPPYKSFIVGGHLTLWNPGLVCYNLVMAGFNCRNAKILSYDYNQSVIAEKIPFERPELVYDRGDLKTLNPWMPKGLSYHPDTGNFEGIIKRHNW